ncbi:MAG: CDP-alcohol phosphatidyltransferase family protein [Chloroflexota bacterium]
MANLLTAARVVLLFITIGFIYLGWAGGGPQGEPIWLLVATVLTFIVFIGDAIDGVVARARGEANALGAVIDIAGDRIVENVYWVVFAHLGLISVWFPIIQITRSFTVDAFRTLALAEGKTAFGETTMMESKFGTWLAASRFNRALYGSAKVVTFIWLLLQMALTVQVARDAEWARNFGNALSIMQTIGIVLAFFTIIYSVLRGAVVVWDSRHYLKP